MFHSGNLCQNTAAGTCMFHVFYCAFKLWSWNWEFLWKQQLRLIHTSKYWKVVSLSEISFFVLVLDTNIRYSSSIYGNGVTLKIKRSGVWFPLPFMCRSIRYISKLHCLSPPSSDGHLVKQKMYLSGSKLPSVYATFAPGRRDNARMYSCIPWKVEQSADTLQKKPAIHQVTTMLATSKNVPFQGHNHLLTTGIDDPTLWLPPKHQQCSWPGNRHF